MMSTTKRTWTKGLYAGFYWLGLAMTLACLALILGGNTDLLYRFEHTSFPLSWVSAGIALLAFLAAELCHSTDSVAPGAEPESPEFAPEWEAVEV